MGHGFQPSTLGGVSKTTIVTLYPLIFWVLVLKLIGIGGIIPSTILADPALNAALTTYFYIGLAHLAIGILILVWQTLAFLRPVQLLRTSIPRMVSNVSALRQHRRRFCSKNPSQGSANFQPNKGTAKVPSPLLAPQAKHPSSTDSLRNLPWEDHCYDRIRPLSITLGDVLDFLGAP